MCRFLAYLGAPVTLDALLCAPSHGLLRQSWAPREQRHGTVNADGFGVGWYDHDRRDEPARYRSARPMWADRSFESIAGVVASTGVLAAVRSATPPLPVEESSTPPFISGPWLFAHNGAVTSYRDGVGAALRRELSDHRNSAIEGASDAELLFALTLERLDAGESPTAALATVVKQVVALSPDSRLNLVLTDGHRIAACARGDSLVVRSGAGLAAGGVIVASEASDDDAGWRAVPEGALVEATKDHVDITTGALP